MNKQTNDPLQSLVVDDAQSLNREALANILKDYVIFDKTSKIPVFTEHFSTLPGNVDKLEIVFLADKAQSLLFPQEHQEGLSQSELLALKIMPEGSVKSSVKKLADNRLILKNAQNKYYLPSYKVADLSTKFRKDRE